MDSITLYQGEDRVLSLLVLDEDGAAVDLSAATEILAAIIVNNRIQSKFSLNFKSGYGSIVVQGTNHNEVGILIRRGSSKDYPVGLMKASVLYELPDGTLTKKRVEKTWDIGNVAKGELAEEVLDFYIPAAPTAPVTNDVANTFDWTFTAGHADPEEYEVSTDSGLNWAQVTTKPHNVGALSFLAGTVQVRVMANPALDQASGAILVNTDPFTA